MRITLDGTAIQKCRGRMRLTAARLASVLGINEITLYRWEADTFSAHQDTAGARIMVWLLTLEDERLGEVAAMILCQLAKDPATCQALLCREMLKKRTVSVPVTE